MASRPISVRLPEAMLAAMDRHLERPDPADGVRTRTDLIQAAVGLWLRSDEAARIDAAIAAGYTRVPVDAADEEFGRISDQAQRDLGEW
jgi:Arc/MetJ-type ribon-helix-helix transcriptional regulator